MVRIEISFFYKEMAIVLVSWSLASVASVCCISSFFLSQGGDFHIPARFYVVVSIILHKLYTYIYGLKSFDRVQVH